MSARAVTLWFLDTDDAADALRAAASTDVADAHRIASAIYGDSVLVPVADTDLATAAAASDSHVYAGNYGPVSVVTCSLFATKKPSTMTKTIASIQSSAAAVLLHTDPADSLGAFARWTGGDLQRSFSANPVDIYEDSGLPFTFERPFWAGEHPLHYADGVPVDPLALPFHPQELAEHANREWLGFRFTHPFAPEDLDPGRIPVTAFAIHPADHSTAEQDWQAYWRRRYEAGEQGSDVPANTDPAATVGTDEPQQRGKLARYFGFGPRSR